MPGGRKTIHVQPNFGENPLSCAAADARNRAEHDHGLCPAKRWRVGLGPVLILFLFGIVWLDRLGFLHARGNFIADTCDGFF